MTPVEHLRFSYTTRGAIDPEVLLAALEEMELAMTVQAKQIHELRTKPVPHEPYTNPEAH